MSGGHQIRTIDLCWILSQEDHTNTNISANGNGLYKLS